MITVFCSSCDKETESEYTTCRHCGARLPDVSVTNWLAAFVFAIAIGGLAYGALTL